MPAKTQTEQQLEDITALLVQPAVTEGEQAEFAIDLSQVVAEQNAANPELNTIAGLDQLTLTPETNVVNLEPETLNPTAAAAEKVTKKAQKEAEKAEKAAAKAAEKAKKEAEKAKKEAEKAAKEVEKAVKKEPAPKQPSQNGITKPKSDSLCGRIWAIASELSEKKGSVVTKKELSEVAEKEGLYPITIGVQYYKWKKFHGLESIKS